MFSRGGERHVRAFLLFRGTSQKAAENIAERMLEDALDLFSPNRTFNAKKKKTPGETPLKRATIAKQYHLTDAFNHCWNNSEYVNHAEKVRAESVDRDQGFENFKKKVFYIFKMRAKVADSAFLARENAQLLKKYYFVFAFFNVFFFSDEDDAFFIAFALE